MSTLQRKPSMTILMYSAEVEGKAREIETALEESVSPDQLAVFRSVDGLTEKLREPCKERPIVIIWIRKKDELLDFASIREQLHPVRLILVLPDAEEGTISVAHRLRPNYLTYSHRNPLELKAVLKRMRGKGGSAAD